MRRRRLCFNVFRPNPLVEGRTFVNAFATNPRLSDDTREPDFFIVRRRLAAGAATVSAEPGGDAVCTEVVDADDRKLSRKDAGFTV